MLSYGQDVVKSAEKPDYIWFSWLPPHQQLTSLLWAVGYQRSAVGLKQEEGGRKAGGRLRTASVVLAFVMPDPIRHLGLSQSFGDRHALPGFCSAVSLRGMIIGEPRRT